MKIPNPFAGTNCRQRDSVEVPRWRSAALARGNQIALETKSQEYRSISGVSLRRWILQDLYGASSGREFIRPLEIQMGAAEGMKILP